jgi:DNA-directed RNA polymerase subunit F
MTQQQRNRLEYLESIEFPTPEENEELRELLNVENDDFIARHPG